MRGSRLRVWMFIPSEAGETFSRLLPYLPLTNALNIGLLSALPQVSTADYWRYYSEELLLRFHTYSCFDGRRSCHTGKQLLTSLAQQYWRPLIPQCFCAVFKAGPSLAIFSLLGVWVLAPWFMALAARLQSNAAVTNTYLEEWPVLLEISLCPPLTMYFGIMQGSIGGLLAATFLMLIAHRTLERGRWIIPPQVRMWLKRSS